MLGLSIILILVGLGIRGCFGWGLFLIGLLSLLGSCA